MIFCLCRHYARVLFAFQGLLFLYFPPWFPIMNHKCQSVVLFNHICKLMLNSSQFSKNPNPHQNPIQTLVPPMHPTQTLALDHTTNSCIKNTAK